MQRKAIEMLNENVENIDTGYKCNRCSGVFDSYGDQIVRCPFCSMICDEIKCRVGETVHQEYQEEKRKIYLFCRITTNREVVGLMRTSGLLINLLEKGLLM